MPVARAHEGIGLDYRGYSPDNALMMDTLIARIERVAHCAGQSPGTLARELFNDGKAWSRLTSGRDISVRVYVRVMQRLDEIERGCRTRRSDRRERVS